MNVKELMIGDWVRQKHSGLLLQVSEIVPPYIFARQGGQFVEDSIEPIILTDEILTANDICHVSNLGYVYEDDEYEVIVSLWDNTCRILYRHDIVVRKECFWNIAVHELQHAMRLAGMDKEIKLEE